MASFPQASPSTPCAHLYPPPYAPHALPISFVSVMYVIINIHLISSQNFCGVLSHLCQGKGKDHILITSVSTGNITLCCGPHVLPWAMGWVGLIGPGNRDSKLLLNVSSYEHSTSQQIWQFKLNNLCKWATENVDGELKYFVNLTFFECDCSFTGMLF